MTPAELQSTLTAAGVPCRIQREEVVIQVCVFCSNAKWNLECNGEKGVFHAWCCKRGGRLDRLLQDLTGERYRIAVQRVAKAVTHLTAAQITDFTSRPVHDVVSAAHYLEQRGITAMVARDYGIVFVDHPGPPMHMLHGRIAIPAKDYWTGEIVGWSGRSYTGKHPKYLSTMQRKIITGWRQRDARAPIVVVEGPMDGVAVHRAGFTAAVLSGIGSIGGEGLEEWAARIPNEQQVVIMLDGEQEAQEQARRLYWKMAAVRTAPLIAVPPPEMDPASIGPIGVRQLVTEAVSTTGST